MRWHISGASWDANDPNMPSVESEIRNILLGQEFYQKEFGTGDSGGSGTPTGIRFVNEAVHNPGAAEAVSSMVDMFGGTAYPGYTITVPEGTKTLHVLAASLGWKSRRHPEVAVSKTATFAFGDSQWSGEVSEYNCFYGVYGWPGYYESELRTDDVAYVGTHTHNTAERNKAYEFSYMHLLSIPVNGATEVKLPENRNIVIFSATAEK